MKQLCGILLGIVLMESIGVGQNLISNSAFDSYYNYLDTNNNLVYHPTDWFYADSIFNHPIYFSTDRYLNKSFGWNIHPDSTSINQGEIANYISVLILPSVHRAYTTLKSPLRDGVKYKLQIDVKAFDQSNYLADLLVGFKARVDEQMDTFLYQLRLVIPDKYCNVGLYDNWITLETEFVARGSEKVLVVSAGTPKEYRKMMNDNKEKFLIMKYQGPPKLKYFLDNIIITEVEDEKDKRYTEKYDTLKPGEEIILNNLYFDFDKYELRPVSFNELKKVYSFLNKHDEIKVQISGHTDNFGDDAYNAKLSLNRATAVKSYLVDKGIPEDRIKVEGFGEAYPIDSNKTSAGRQNNRRIEMMIVP